MKPEQINIKIAEVCGWKKCRYIPAEQLTTKPFNTWRVSATVGISPLDDEGDGERGIPDYVNSLDAIHEAEKVLTGDQRFNFRAKLALMFPKNGWESVHASAPQRAEALLRTLSLWED